MPRSRRAGGQSLRRLKQSFSFEFAGRVWRIAASFPIRREPAAEEIFSCDYSARTSFFRLQNSALDTMILIHSHLKGKP